MFYYLFSVLSALWIYDLVQTLRFSGKMGAQVEKNPLARFLLKTGKKEFILFKILDLALLGIVIGLLRADYESLAEIMLLSFIALYIFTVAHNQSVQKSVKQ